MTEELEEPKKTIVRWIMTGIAKIVLVPAIVLCTVAFIFVWLSEKLEGVYFKLYE